MRTTILPYCFSFNNLTFLLPTPQQNHPLPGGNKYCFPHPNVLLTTSSKLAHLTHLQKTLAGPGGRAARARLGWRDGVGAVVVGV
ncbi:hypothetical protein HBI56_119260 [Parastagonospora nodorum]|nr:hypothetical protein HBH50_135750 [Parastagonospora nodorum]KAH4107817.1 hypothetical protein HBH46_049380 [Parastagonospora nodorum]KAH4195686.1 hypothetical protein HBH42_075550 [Parastagonospora nodorum]KAH4276290.1 hypothetical protein HBI04_106650 [Parastagonospora nodorum]KAH4808535.1 hypothetical protein HBH61_121790 [Parastagonospora nodorum]